MFCRLIFPGKKFERLSSTININRCKSRLGNIHFIPMQIDFGAVALCSPFKCQTRWFFARKAISSTQESLPSPIFYSNSTETFNAYYMFRLCTQYTVSFHQLAVMKTKKTAVDNSFRLRMAIFRCN